MNSDRIYGRKNVYSEDFISDCGSKKLKTYMMNKIVNTRTRLKEISNKLGLNSENQTKSSTMRTHNSFKDCPIQLRNSFKENIPCQDLNSAIHDISNVLN